MPLPRVPQRGDAARLQQLASGLKMEHGTYGAVVQRNEPGRPTGSGAGKAAPAEVPVTDEHRQMFGELARAEVTRQQWAALAAQSPTPWILGMQEIADENYNAIAERVYNSTPNQEF